MSRWPNQGYSWANLCHYKLSLACVFLHSSINTKQSMIVVKLSDRRKAVRSPAFISVQVPNFGAYLLLLLSEFFALILISAMLIIWSFHLLAGSYRSCKKIRKVRSLKTCCLCTFCFLLCFISQVAGLVKIFELYLYFPISMLQ